MLATDVMIMAQDIHLDPSSVDMGKQFFSLTIPESWQRVSRVISVIAMIIWVIVAAWNFFNVKNQGRGLQRIGGIWPLIAAALVAGIFWDLQNVVRIANFLIALGASGIGMFTNLLGGG